MIEHALIEISESPCTASAPKFLPLPRGCAAVPLAPGNQIPRLRRSFPSTPLRFVISTAFVVAVIALTLVALPSTAKAGDDNFSDVVKVIERFYRVKHKGIPFLARAGMKTAVTAARIAGGSKRRLAEVGSVKVAYFEDQDFASGNGPNSFKSTINATLSATWSPLIQVAAPKEGEQVYIFLREAGEKFNVLVITIERRDASVVQVTLSPSTLAKLMQDPNEMGDAINAEATVDNE